MPKRSRVRAKTSEIHGASLVMCLAEVDFDYMLKIGRLSINNSMY